MKSEIITIHAMHNPGSVYQAYALQQYLIKYNQEVEIIDYRPDYFYKEKSGIKYYIKKLLFNKLYKSRNNRFNEFINKNMQLSDQIKSYEKLENYDFNADKYIVGSDQLWNSDFACGNDLAFYLDFVEDNSKKYSYSTSVGKKIIDKNNYDILKEHLNKFNLLSVREKSTAIFLQKELQRQVNFVCDPVFLLKKEEYLKFINPINITNKFVMVYLTPKNDIVDSLVQRYKDEGYTIILVGGFSKRCECDIHIKDAGPEEFLSYIYYSSVVISTSFHATAFAHIFHKDFYTILPKNNSERIESLLSVSNLLERGLSSFKISSNKIDWNDVDIKIENYVNESKEYIDSIYSK